MYKITFLPVVILCVGCLSLLYWLAFRLTGNVLALGAVADFGAQNCQYTKKVDAR
jgi:4-amino-4-deoxy-L-arabinose transferase-like glycosyltransferase